jgi:hypothetical protein
MTAGVNNKAREGYGFLARRFAAPRNDLNE